MEKIARWRDISEITLVQGNIYFVCDSRPFLRYLAQTNTVQAYTKLGIKIIPERVSKQKELCFYISTFNRSWYIGNIKVAPCSTPQKVEVFILR